MALPSFEDAAVQRPEIQRFLPRVAKREGQGALNPRYAAITMRLRDGRVLERRVEALRGGPTLPLSDEELGAKLADCLAHAGLPGDAPSIAAAILDPSDRPVAEVLALLASPPRAQAAE